MRRRFAIWSLNTCIAFLFLVASNSYAEPTVFTGRLVKKHYEHLIPQAVEQNVFGWFVELDSFSKVRLQEKVTELSDEDRQCCEELGFDSTIVQLCLSGAADRLLCCRLEGQWVEVSGKWPSSPHVFRPIPSYQLHLTEMKQIPADEVALHGVLCCKIFPGPPNYDSIEDGDYPEKGWILKLDGPSKNKLVRLEETAEDEIAIETDERYENILQQYANHAVICVGRLHSAETAHHPTSLRLCSCKLIAAPQF